MKALAILGCLLSLSAFVGTDEVTAQDKAPPKPALKRAITIGIRISDWLLIHSDGSGIVGFGDGPGRQFTAGTFDVEKVTKELKKLPIDPKGEWRTHYYFGFESERKGPEKPGPRYHTQDPKLIPALFQKAIEASGKTRDDFPPGFGELNTPPPRDNK